MPARSRSSARLRDETNEDLLLGRLDAFPPTARRRGLFERPRSRRRRAAADNAVAVFAASSCSASRKAANGEALIRLFNRSLAELHERRLRAGRQGRDADPDKPIDPARKSLQLPFGLGLVEALAPSFDKLERTISDITSPYQ